jgi:hypothetical protein
MSHVSKLVTSIVGLVVMAMVASRQLFLFAVSSERLNLSTSGGMVHFWLAAVAGITACVAGGLMFYFSKRHEETKWPKVEVTPAGPPLTPAQLNPLISPAPAPFDPVSWALANPWLSEGQADDRMPMDGSVTDSGQTPPGQREFTRRTHQVMFKKWSQTRHY